MGYGLCSRLALRLVGLPPKSIDLVATKHPTATTHLIALAGNTTVFTVSTRTLRETMLQELGAPAATIDMQAIP